jgi:hypothetical protein
MQNFFSDIELITRRLIIGLIVLVSLYTLIQYFRTPLLGQALRGEWNLWTVSQAMMDFFIAIVAAMCAVLGYYIWRRGIARDKTWVAWLLIALAFTYFTLDETLQFHERAGKALRQTSVDPSVLGFRPHNVVEASYYFGALVLTVIIFRRLKQNRRMLVFYMSGVGFMAFQTTLGLIPVSMGNARLPFMFPELLEMAAITCFACAFISLASEQVRQIAEWLIRTTAPHTKPASLSELTEDKSAIGL